jgi:ketosteroid isomerase-like protein
MTHPNEQIIRDGFAAFSAGDQEALRRVIAVDAVWHVPGRNPLAGSYKGIEEILGFFGKRLRSPRAPSPPTCMTCLATTSMSSPRAPCLGSGAGSRCGTAPCSSSHVQDGKVTEAWGTAGDQYATDEFWS